MWQSLGFGPKYKSAYCQAVCPAGDDVIGPYMADRAAWRQDVMVPLLRKEENIYVRSGTRAERVALRKPAKRVRYIDYRPDVSSPANFVLGLRHRFDRARAASVNVTLVFAFPDGSTTTVEVSGGTLRLSDDASASPAACVELLDDYIRLLHPDLAPTPRREALYRLTGDPAALGGLLACLD